MAKRASLSISEPNERWIQAQIDGTAYCSRSEVLNDLIRKARATEAIRTRLESAERFEAIAASPLRYPGGRPHIREGYRRSVLGSDSIYFRIGGETAEIMAIVGKQNLDEWL